MLYTRRGDDGTSGLFGGKGRLPKDCPLFEALGTVDELNSLLGVCFAKAESNKNEEIVKLLRASQEDLFIVQAELAGADKKLEQSHVDRLEGEIAKLEARFENPNSFIIAGGSELSALLDYARSVSRRAERQVLAVQSDHPTSSETHKYLNRLSSFLYAAARFAAASAGVEEQKPSY